MEPKFMDTEAEQEILVEPDSTTANIFNVSLEELQEYFRCIDEPDYRATQVLEWLYKKNVHKFDGMSNLPKPLRVLLNQSFRVDLPVIRKVYTDPDDGTRKYVIELKDGSFIESVLIFEDGKRTLCLSSQAGCPLGCKFCHTGINGYIRNLTQAEIVTQLILGREIIAPEPITNLVFMGMGEPFLNYRTLARALRIITSDHTFGISPRRITVSTSGIIPGIRKFGEEFPRMNFALSLNATTDSQRLMIMPVTKKYPLEDLLKECRSYPLPRRKRITIEYVMIKDFNDSRKDARRLASLLRGIRCKINLIPINASGLTQWVPPESTSVEIFQKILLDSGYTVMLRKSKGVSIWAACGQLGSGNHEDKDLDS